MGDNKSNKDYSYEAMSNKVQIARRSGRRSDPTGEVEALRPGSEAGRMGDRVVTASSRDSRRPRGGNQPDEDERNKKKLKREGQRSAAANVLGAGRGQSILEYDNLTGYQPTTPGSRIAYETILATVASKSLLGSQASSILRDAAEEVIQVLKDASLRDPQRQDQISKILTGKSTSKKQAGSLTTEQFSSFVRLGKQLDDYGEKATTTDEGKEENEMGIAVVFNESGDEDDDNDGSDVEGGLVVDMSSDDESNSDNSSGTMDTVTGGDEEKMLQGETKKKNSRSEIRTLSVHEIDAHFLQRQLARHIEDATEAAKLAADVLAVLDIRDPTDVRKCENKLLLLLRFELFDIIKLLLHNRIRVWACVSMKGAQSQQDRELVEKALMDEPTGEGKQIWEEIHSKSRADEWSRKTLRGLTQDMKTTVDASAKDVSQALDSIAMKSETDVEKRDSEEDKKGAQGSGAAQLDLDQLTFRDGAHTMSNTQCNLPDSSWRAMKKGYEEVHVPAVRSVIPKGEKLVPIGDLPEWTHAAFKGVEKLNRIQSKMCDVALRSSENLLLCAPTGAGKTNVACLTMLNVLSQYMRQRSAKDMDVDGQKTTFDLSAFKIVYVAPMKALVQEVVKNFGHRLADYGIVVRELSGDSSLSRQEISETQLLVTTPEKWDVVTRQGEGRAFTQLVKLVIIDEIHLLHDDRGPVLESIVARVVRQVEATAEPIRLVGLSATLPNYADVAAFLRVKPDKGLFFFDSSFRPVPLQMQYIGITERSAFRRMQLQNEICYEKALAQRQKGSQAHQLIIFVHSRAETGKTAKALRDLALERDELSNFVREGGGTQEILREEVASVKNPDLKEVLQYGFAIHHAGMVRADRELVEELFADRHIAVLISTATLAWGVNLPARAVIIKGTQIYDPSKGRWAELSPLDVLQMLGRAGRPQYDTQGEGIIMTQHSELQYYLSLTNLQLPVESQLVKTLPDHLNAEIVLGSVQTLEEASNWLSYTFLYVRMLQHPSFYGIPESEAPAMGDSTLKQRRTDLAHSAALILEKSQLIRYDRKSGSLQSTALGRIASQFYISHSSMAVYNRHMRPNMGDIELLRLFAMSGEFAHITVREEEKLELTKLASRVPIPIKESPSEPSAKVNILLQAYISRLKLDGFALVADMAFIQQSAARITRCLFEIALRRNWSQLAKMTLAFSNMVAHKVWRSQSPLRQFKNVPEMVSRKLERKSDIEWNRYSDLTVSDLGELVGVPKMGRVLHKLVAQFPRLELSGARVQPITRSLLRIDLNLMPAFKFDVSIHGYVQLFHVFVEDVNCETILHHEYFSLKSTNREEEHTVVFSVPVLEPLPPAYFVRVLSDRWLHSEAVLPVSFSNLILPAKFPPPTELLDLQPLLPSAVGDSTLAKLFPFKEFNPIQTQTFHELFKTDKNCLICAPSGSGKSVCAEFAVLRMLLSNSDGKCVYVAPTDHIADVTFENWSNRFGSIFDSDSIARLQGDIVTDLKSLSKSRVAICSVCVWDMLTRRWRQRKATQAVSLLIFDEVHFLGGEVGPTMEIVISRARYMNQSKPDLRVICLGASIANARDLAEWIGVPHKNLFNFSPKVRPWPLEIYFSSFDQNNFSSRLMAMAKPVYHAVTRHSNKQSTIIYVPSRRQAQLTAIDMMTYQESEGRESYIGEGFEEEVKDVVNEIRDPALRQVLVTGIGFVYKGMVQSDKEITVQLFAQKKIKIIVCPADLCWELRCVAFLVIIMGTELYDGREKRHVDYKIADMLHMMGRHDTGVATKCVIMCHQPKKETLKKLLYDPLPVESHLDSYLHDHIISEVVTETIKNMQDAVDYLTWSFLYRRLAKNPTYYRLRGTSNVHISEYLSDLIETVIGDLEESKCIKVSDDGEISSLNLGMIAAYYYIQFKTIDIIATSVTSTTKIRGVLEILSASWEFASLPLRFGEEKSVKMLARTQPYALPDTPFDAHSKCLVLFQCHFSRKVVPTDLRPDQHFILTGAIKLIQATVDVISSNGWLKPALAAMELSQMIVQGLWNKDHVLKQIPHFSDEIIRRCENHKGEDQIDSVFDILTIDDSLRNELLQLPDDKMADVAHFCNNYPNIEVSYEVQDPENVIAGEPVRVVVTLEREIDEDDISEEELAQLGTVSAPLFPSEKKEAWWIVIGDTSLNLLHALKRATLTHQKKVVLDFNAPEEQGDYNLKLFCMSDSYLGCDQEYSFALSVAAGEESGSDSDSEESDDDEK